MPTLMEDPTPSWLKPENASVLDPAWVKLLRAIATANPLPKGLQNRLPNPNPAAMVLDPQSQVLGLMGADVPSGGPIKAFHASPYNFEKFDSSKIGTGQGAQSFGHGHYSAQMQPTAETYLHLATPEVTVGGKSLPIPNWDPKMPPEQRLIRRIGDARAGMREAPEANILAKVKADLAHEAKNKWGDDATIAAAKEQQRLLAEWEQQGLASKHGHMYEIAINADPKHLLDWDKPMREQSPHVQAAASQQFQNVQPVKLPDGWYSVTRVDRDGIGHTMTSEIKESTPEVAMQRFQEIVESESGGNLYARLGAPEAASAKLREAGVPGIKYLDQGSRQAGEGTYNYVITDDKLIDILRKFGFLLPAVGAANYGAAYDKAQEAK
jgi:hypothetical protein